jgi:hypothetical protein
MPASRPPGDQPPNIFAVHQPAAAAAASAGGDSGDSRAGEAPGGLLGSAAAPRVELPAVAVGRRSRRRGWRLPRPGRRLSVVAAALLLGGLACTALIENLGRRDRPATDTSSKRLESAAPAPTSRKPIRRSTGKKDGAAANQRRRRSRDAQPTPGRDHSVARHRAADRPEPPAVPGSRSAPPQPEPAPGPMAPAPAARPPSPPPAVPSPAPAARPSPPPAVPSPAPAARPSPPPAVPAAPPTPTPARPAPRPTPDRAGPRPAPVAPGSPPEFM